MKKKKSTTNRYTIADSRYAAPLAAARPDGLNAPLRAVTHVLQLFSV
jgi:hypothetical protein